MEDLFEVVMFPDVQALMEKEGFDENSVLINDESLLSEYGSSAYLVRKSWLLSLDYLLKDREEVIEELINDSIDTVIQANENGDTTYIDSIFRNGFKGFSTLSDEDLEKEYMELFEIKIKIVYDD